MASYNVDSKVQEKFLSSVVNAVNNSKSINVFMLSDLEAAGYKYAAFEFGRDIDQKHVQDLYKVLARDGKAVFTKRVVAMSAEAVLEGNEQLDEAQKPIRVFDLNGQELTLESSDIEHYLVYLDGNHRWFCHHLHPEIDMEVEIAVVSDPFQFMADYNSLSNNWNLKHWLHANVILGRTDEGVHSDIASVETQLGVSMKYASYLLTREREAVKKSDLEIGKDTTVNNPNFVERGKILGNTIAVLFPKPGMDATDIQKLLYKGVRMLQFLDAVEAADKANPTKPVEFAKQFSAYLCCLSDNDQDVLSRLFLDKDYASLKKNICKGYAAFLKAHDSDMDEQIASAEEMTAQVLSEPKDAKPAVLKSGTATALIHSMEVQSAYQESKVADKALTKANEALTKAQEKILVAEDKFNTASDKAKDGRLKVLQEAQKALTAAEEAVSKAKDAKETAVAKYNKLTA